MNKSELVAKVAESNACSKKLAREIVDSLFDSIECSLSSGRTVVIRGFGTFKVKKTRERNAVNPGTGEKITVPSKFVPVFKSSRSLDEQLKK